MAALVPLLGAGPIAPAPSQVAIMVFDVGRGQAAVIRTRREVIVFGTGDSFGTNGRRMARVVVPWLRSQHITRVDRLVMPHLRGDHASGAAELVAAIAVEEILVPRPWPGGPEHVALCADTSAWTSGPARFTMTADCDLSLSIGPRQFAFARPARFDTARGGAISVMIDAASGDMVQRGARDGYPWPWRAPV